MKGGILGKVKHAEGIRLTLLSTSQTTHVEGQLWAHIKPSIQTGRARASVISQGLQVAAGAALTSLLLESARRLHSFLGSHV